MRGKYLRADWNEIVKQHLGRRRHVASSVVDSMGLKCTMASGYFVRRRKRVDAPWKTVVYHHYPKLRVVCDRAEPFILAIATGRDPRPDADELRSLVGAA